eukprot:82381-Chlamydomonas_euryale.AAC.10
MQQPAFGPALPIAFASHACWQLLGPRHVCCVEYGPGFTFILCLCLPGRDRMSIGADDCGCGAGFPRAASAVHSDSCVASEAGSVGRAPVGLPMPEFAPVTMQYAPVKASGPGAASPSAGRLGGAMMWGRACADDAATTVDAPDAA